MGCGPLPRGTIIDLVIWCLAKPSVVASLSGSFQEMDDTLECMEDVYRTKQSESRVAVYQSSPLHDACATSSRLRDSISDQLCSATAEDAHKLIHFNRTLSAFCSPTIDYARRSKRPWVTTNALRKPNIDRNMACVKTTLSNPCVEPSTRLFFGGEMIV